MTSLKLSFEIRLCSHCPCHVPAICVAVFFTLSFYLCLSNPVCVSRDQIRKAQVLDLGQSVVIYIYGVFTQKKRKYVPQCICKLFVSWLLLAISVTHMRTFRIVILRLMNSEWWRRSSCLSLSLLCFQWKPWSIFHSAVNLNTGHNLLLLLESR